MDESTPLDYRHDTLEKGCGGVGGGNPWKMPGLPLRGKEKKEEKHS